MGYAHGTKWTEEKVKEEILKVKEALVLDRMPTRNEINMVMGNSALTDKISKTIGYYGWAEKLNLPIKDSETTLGKTYEYEIKKILEEKGFKVEKMSQNYPFDLLVNDHIRIDVKTANLYTSQKVGSWYTFNLYKKYATCDIYIFVCLGEKAIKRIMVIPSKELRVQQLSVGEESMYNKYIDKFDYITKYDYLYKLI